MLTIVPRWMRMEAEKGSRVCRSYNQQSAFPNSCRGRNRLFMKGGRGMGGNGVMAPMFSLKLHLSTLGMRTGPKVRGLLKQLL